MELCGIKIIRTLSLPKKGHPGIGFSELSLRHTGHPTPLSSSTASRSVAISRLRLPHHTDRSVGIPHKDK